MTQDDYCKNNSESNVQGLERAVFTNTSLKDLNQLDAVRFAEEQGSILQSGTEAFAGRLQSGHSDSVLRKQRTRLAACYGFRDNSFFVAFDDVSDVENNPVLARAQEGYDLNREDKELIVSGSALQDIVKRARHNNRLLQVPEDGVVMVETRESGADKYIHAIAGHAGPAYAESLKEKGHDKWYVGMMKHADIRKVIRNKDDAIVRPVGIGAWGYVYVQDKFNSKGYARGCLAEPPVHAAWTTIDCSDGEPEKFYDALKNKSMIILITGKRGGGKTALGFSILENLRSSAQRPQYVVGVKQSVVPPWIKRIDDIDAARNGGVVLVDEGALEYSSRTSMNKKNKELGDIMLTARHKDLTFIFLTQSTGMIDKSVLNLCDAVLFKEGSLLQNMMERPAMKDICRKASAALKKFPEEKRIEMVYVSNTDFEGVCRVPLPSFWSEELSKNKA